MGQVRERPRLAAARALAVIALIATGMAIGALLDGPEGTPRVEAQLLRAKIESGEQADRLDRTGVELQRVRAELGEALARERDLTRANSRLRRNVRVAKRDLRRAQRAGQRARRASRAR